MAFSFLRALKIDQLRGRIHHHPLGCGIGAALALLPALMLLIFPFGRKLTNLSYDIPFVFRSVATPQEAVIVYLDEPSYEKLGQSHRYWDRSLHARLIQRLTAEGAKAVVFDILLDDPGTNSAVDIQLAQAMRTNRTVLLAAELSTTKYEGGIQVKPRPPLTLFRQSAAGWGLIKFAHDPDFGIRLHFNGIEDYPSLPWTAAAMIGAPLTKTPEKRMKERWYNYYGQAGDIPSVSYFQVLQPAGVSPGFFRDKVVFIGSRLATDYPGVEKDEFRGPYTWWDKRFYPGVEIHATAFINLLRQDWLNRWSPMSELAMVVLMGLAFGYGLPLFRPLTAAIVAVVGVSGVIVFAYSLFAFQRLWFSWLIIAGVQIPLAIAWSVVFNSIRLFVEKQKLQLQNQNLELQRQRIELQAQQLELKTQNLELETQNLALQKQTLELQTKNLEQSLAFHLSPARVKQLMERPDLLRPGVDKMEVSIMFSDIENFSKFSETLPSDELARILNNYYETAISCVHDTEGTVVKLLGDSIFAIWNAPSAQSDHRDRGCRAALLLAEKLDVLGNTQRSLPLRTRVGLHTGMACVGNVGSSTRFDYTAIGESINLASRLEGLNRHMDTQILATIDIRKEMAGSVMTRLIGTIKFKGFGRSVEVHEILGTLKKAESARLWIDTFEFALAKFKGREFDVADQKFRETIELRGKLEEPHLSPEFRHKDGPSQLYLKLISQYRLTPPPREWIGEVDMTEK